MRSVIMKRLVSKDFIAAMEEKLEWGRNQGRTGWDSKWKKISVDSFTIHNLRNKLEEEVWELEDLIFALLDYEETGSAADVDLADVRLEAADVANVAMMIADMAGALNES
jgi:NTP pyrophosphatase (non-canonical NTP hydrolase)